MGAEVWKLAGFALAASAAAMAVRAYRPEFGQQIAVAAGLAVLLFAMERLGGAYGTLREWLNRYGLQGDFFAVLIKVTGVVYLVQFAADVCKDAGESAMANRVELAGRVMVITLCLPAIGSILETIAAMLGRAGE